VDTDAKKAELFRKGLTIQLQDHLILSQNLSYNELASAPLKYRMVYTPPAGQPRRPPPQLWGNHPQQPQQQQYNHAPPTQQQ
jgi:hypothetical protein